jgi:hypothetical protein
MVRGVAFVEVFMVKKLAVYLFLSQEFRFTAKKAELHSERSILNVCQYQLMHSLARVSRILNSGF